MDQFCLQNGKNPHPAIKANKNPVKQYLKFSVGQVGCLSNQNSNRGILRGVPRSSAFFRQEFLNNSDSISSQLTNFPVYKSRGPTAQEFLQNSDWNSDWHFDRNSDCNTYWNSDRNIDWNTYWNSNWNSYHNSDWNFYWNSDLKIADGLHFLVQYPQSISFLSADQ